MMVLASSEWLVWTKDGDDMEYKYEIPGLYRPMNLTREEEDFEAIQRLERERDSLIRKVIELTGQLRDLSDRYESLTRCNVIQSEKHSDTQNKLLLSIMNTHVADGDLFVGRDLPMNMQNVNEFERLHRYLLGKSEESRVNIFKKGVKKNNLEHEYSFGDQVSVYKIPRDNVENDDLVPTGWGGRAAIIVGENETHVQVLCGYIDDLRYYPYWLPKENIGRRYQRE